MSSYILLSCLGSTKNKIVYFFVLFSNGFFFGSNIGIFFLIYCTTYESGDIAWHIHFISDTINLIVQV